LMTSEKDRKRKLFRPVAEVEEDEERQAEEEGLDMNGFLLGEDILRKLPKVWKYDEEGLKEALESFSLSSSPWIERLEVVSSDPIDVENVHDDFQRELTIFEATLKGVKEAQAKLDRLNFPHRRPDDFLAEMIKTDDHMKKVRVRLLQEKQRIEEFEEKKKQKEMKKFGKQVQIEKQQEKIKNKKDNLESIKKWREKKKQDGGADDFDIALEEEDPKVKRNNLSKNKDPLKRKVSHKRELKNKKYGFGGPKKRTKNNTAESAADDSGFSARANKKYLGSQRGVKKGSQLKRPGKVARLKSFKKKSH